MIFSSSLIISLSLLSFRLLLRCPILNFSFCFFFNKNVTFIITKSIRTIKNSKVFARNFFFICLLTDCFAFAFFRLFGVEKIRVFFLFGSVNGDDDDAGATDGD